MRLWANPQYRKLHFTPEHCDNLSLARAKLWADPEYKTRVSASISKSWRNPSVRKAHLEGMQNSPHAESRMCKISSCNRRRAKDPMYRRRVSEGLLKSYACGNSKPLGRGRHSKSGYFKASCGTKYYYQSSWELAVLLILNGQPGVKMLPRIGVGYSHKGKCHTYFPDGLFEYRRKTYMYEVKPLVWLRWAFRYDLRIVTKLHAAVEYCRERGLTFLLITEYPATFKECFHENLSKSEQMLGRN
jgi:hypothetical protein